MDSLTSIAFLLIIFVFAALLKLLFAFKRVYDFYSLKFRSPTSLTYLAPRDWVSHSWSEAAIISTQRAKIFTPNEIHCDLEQCNATAGTSKDEGGEEKLILQKVTEILDAHGIGVTGNAFDRSSRRSSCYKYVKFSNDFTTVLKQDWQTGQLTCVHCEVSLRGQRYIIRNERSYCRLCYQALFANNCDKCNETINFDSKDLTYEDKHWHEQCFLCTGCRALLVNQKFVYIGRNIYCQPCYDARLCTRCFKCEKEFKAGMKKFGYKGRQWHSECFSCSVCGNHIGKNAFVSRGKSRDLICISCCERRNNQLAENLLACEKCTKCKQTVQLDERVLYKELCWHRICFSCSHCSCHLVNASTFILIDGSMLCCNNCCHEIYDRKCFTCRKPITAEEDRTLISFGGHHWHSKCFKCSRCDLQLAGRGFLTDGPHIVCPYCVI